MIPATNFFYFLWRRTLKYVKDKNPNILSGYFCVFQFDFHSLWIFTRSYLGTFAPKKTFMSLKTSPRFIILSSHYHIGYPRHHSRICVCENECGCVCVWVRATLIEDYVSHCFISCRDSCGHSRETRTYALIGHSCQNIFHRQGCQNHYKIIFYDN